MWEQLINQLDTRALRKYAEEDRRRKGTPEERRLRLVQAIQDYWGDDLRKATRDQRRAFARELADMIANNITHRGD
jgi:hypothetical protein